MRTTTVKLAGLALLLGLLLGGPALGQPGSAGGGGKKPAEEKRPSQLEELLAQALRDNPDLRVAEAKVREAEAELNRARLQVIQKVVAHQHTIETLVSAVRMAEANFSAAEAKLRQAEAQLARIVELSKRGAVAREDVDAAQAKVLQSKADIETAKAGLQAAKADLAKAQAELPYLLGKGGKADHEAEAVKRAIEFLNAQPGQAGDGARALIALAAAQAQGAGKGAAQPQGTVADKLRKALDKTINLNFEADMRLGEILDYLQSLTGVSMVTTLPRDTKLPRINIQNVTLGAAFQCIEDVGRVQFGVRDYGILVSDQLPSGVTRLHDFWKSEPKPKAGEEKPKSSGRNPPPGDVEGEVVEVDAGQGLAAISFKGGVLAKGQTLEVYRLADDKAHKYLGTLRIEEVKDGGRAVGKFINKLNAPVKVGDRVSSKFFVD